MSFFNVLKHGLGRATGFIFLVIFSVVRLAGNVLLVIAYKQNYDNATIVEWGYILQSLGYTFFLSATLAFYQRAKSPPSLNTSGGAASKLKSPAGILGLASTIGLILLIVGYTDSTGIFPNSSGTTDPNATLNVKAKIGDCIFCGVTLIIALLTVTSIGSSQTWEAKKIFQFILLALPFMAVRVAYVTYQSFSKHPLDRTLWIKIAFDYVMEVFVILIYFILGFATRNAAARDVEMVQDYPSNGQGFLSNQNYQEHSNNQGYGNNKDYRPYSYQAPR
ncbi:hypothetical protein CBS101457_002440 [Exobasidium rhododendri]|nr:hypothetical protein CBS101457_002440 [Exobasidium rhododendri]